MERIIPDERIRHMHGVAEYMYRNAEKHQLRSDQMYVLGLLHDIGYMNGKIAHEAFGANLIKSLGFEMDYVIAILWHGSKPSDFLALTKKTAKNVPNEMILLWEADMHVNSKGEEVTYDDRLLDIRERYGEDSNEYKNCQEIIDFLKKNGF